MNRYSSAPIISGKTIGKTEVCKRIYNAVRSGRLNSKKRVLQQGERLDIIAAKFYGSGTYWWVIAAASGIGWAPQVPAGTVLTIPVSLVELRNVAGL